MTLLLVLEVDNILRPAINYKEKLKQAMDNIWFEEKYKFWQAASYYDEFIIDNSSWNRHQFVSIAQDGAVIGYIGYNIDRDTNSCHTLSIVNFSDNPVAFGLDLHKALTDIFERYRFRKLNFSVIMGNPIEKSYDKMITKYGGRIVGYYKEDVKLIDGNYYDKKLYEITREDYIERKRQ